METSIWNHSQKLPRFKTLQGEHKTDVLIIGGGLSGILCAYFLKQAGVDYMLVEGSTIAGGTTGNTTAKITSQHGLIYDKLIRAKGREQALMYLQANERALEKYRELAQNIDCDFQEKDAYVYSMDDRSKIEREVQAVNALGFPAEFRQDVKIPLEIAGAVRFPKQAQFHPLKFIAAITEDLNIYEHTMIRELARKKAWNEEAQIQAEKIIIATHFPFLNKNGSYFLKLYQHRSYVLALKNAPDVDGMYVDESRTGLSFRNYQEYLLLGGGSHRTGKEGGNWRELRNTADIYYPSSKEVCAWAAQDCMPLDDVPYIGQYSRNTPDLYVASGFHKWGMTTSMAAAMVLTDLVQGRSNEWAEVFDSGRSILHPQLLVNGFEAVTNLLTPTRKRCPHLGCALKWNPAEHTWDCPCHGSRFEEDGKLINNPATGDAHISDVG